MMFSAVSRMVFQVLTGGKVICNDGQSYLRKPQHLSAKRATAASAETLRSWFTTVRSFREDVCLLTHRGPVADFAACIWNSDETGFYSTSKKSFPDEVTAM